MKIAVLDIGGTLIKAGIMENGTLHSCGEYETRAAEGGMAVLTHVIEIVRSFGAVDRVGISTAGEVDVNTGTIRMADNIPGYTGLCVKKILHDALSMPVAVENDVNAAAVGEFVYGAARGKYKDFLCVCYGTGVGGAAILNGELYRGSCFSAGEFGGLVTHMEALVHGDVGSGCYERYASTTALVRGAMQVDPSLSNGRAVFAAMQRKEVKAVVDAWTAEVSYGLISLIHAFNPEAIVLGGGIMREAYVLEKLEATVKANTKKSFRSCTILTAALGNNAGLYGAAHLAAKLPCE